MNNVTLKFNMVSSRQDNTLVPVDCSWEQLRGLMSKAHLRTGEKDGAGWIPCSAVDSAGSRCQENMQEAYLLVLDIDTGVALADVKAKISGLEAAIHSSYSHTLEKPKWRVVMPLKEALPAARISDVFDIFQERFDGLLDAACGHDPARLYYLPACPKGSEHLFVFERLEGELLDGAAMVRASAVVVPKSTEASCGAGSPGELSAGVTEGGRNNDLFKHACKLFANGMSPELVTDACLKRNGSNVPPLEDDEVKRAVVSAQRRVERNVLATTESVIDVVNEMNRNYAWVEKQGMAYRFQFRDFVRFDQLRQQFANTGLRVKIGGAEKWLNDAEIWQRSDTRRTHANVNFIPGGAPIVENCINFWKGWGATAVAGDISPWNELLDHLFSGDAAMRLWFEQWLAYPFRHPGTKLTTAAVLWSGKQGVGKSMIGETIGLLYGPHFRTITSGELHGAFNGWMRDCQFALGEENSSSSQRADANRLKFLITGATIFVNEKHQPAIELNNCANFLFTSNHADAFYLEDADRRFFIWEIVAERKSNEFYDRFVDWRDNRGGLSALMDHLLRLDLAGFSPKGNAPITEAKREMIRQSKTDLERWLGDALEDPASVKVFFGKEVVHLDDLTEVYMRQRSCRATTTAVSRAFQRMGFHAKRRVVTRKGRQNLISIANHEKWDMADATDWVAEYSRPTPVKL